jgi:hypothetical protein
MHVHHLEMWEHWMERLPTTPPEAAYGTPLMAGAIRQLLREQPEPRPGLLVMGGHREGLIAFGATHDQAGRHLLSHLAALPGSR